MLLFNKTISEEILRRILVLNPNLIGEDAIIDGIEKPLDTRTNEKSKRMDLVVKDSKDNLTIIELKDVPISKKEIDQINDYIVLYNKRYVENNASSKMLISTSVPFKIRQTLVNNNIQWKEFSLETLMEMFEINSFNNKYFEFLDDNNITWTKKEIITPFKNYIEHKGDGFAEIKIFDGKKINPNKEFVTYSYYADLYLEFEKFIKDNLNLEHLTTHPYKEFSWGFAKRYKNDGESDFDYNQKPLWFRFFGNDPKLMYIDIHRSYFKDQKEIEKNNLNADKVKNFKSWSYTGGKQNTYFMIWDELIIDNFEKITQFISKIDFR